MSKNNFFLLNKLTILILSYNRQKFAIRNMKYWSGTNVSVILIDGSQKKIDKDILSKFHKNIIYIHSPKDYVKRIKSFLYKIKTKYVILGCDDEFYIPSALNSCLKNLIKDRELSACGGFVWGFEFKNKLMLGFNAYPSLKKIFLSESDPNIRLQKHFSNYTTIHYYSVCRTDLFKIAIKEVFKKNSPVYDCYAMSEILLEFLICYSGKSKVIPELMTLRSGENIGINSLNPDEKVGFNFFNKKILERFDYWWLDKNNKLKKDQLINFVKLCCKKIDSINRNMFPCNIANIFENYVKFLQKDKKPFYIYFKSFYRYFPLFLRDNIKELLKYFGYFEDNLRKTNMLKSINLLKKEKVFVDLNQLKNIDKILKDFYNYKLLK